MWKGSFVTYVFLMKYFNLWSILFKCLSRTQSLSTESQCSVSSVNWFSIGTSSQCVPGGMRRTIPDKSKCGKPCVCVSGWWVMFARLFSNTVMDVGTFARLGPEPLTYHLRERERCQEMDSPASLEDDKTEWQKEIQRKGARERERYRFWLNWGPGNLDPPGSNL